MCIPENSFIYINVAIIVIYLLSIYKAFKRGFLYETINFFGFIASLLISWFLAPIMAKYLPIVTELDLSGQGEEIVVNILSPIVNTVVWTVLLLVIIKLVLTIILPLFKGVSKIPVIGSVNRILGAIFGVFDATIWILIFSMLLSMPFFENGQEVKNHTFVKYVNEISDKALIFITENVELPEGIEYEIDDIDDFREKFTDWLIEQGVIDEK